jgi:hypothetical protein
MLREKETYNFNVLRRITLPDESDYWVLTLDGSDRFLLPLEFYAGYNISEGRQLLCRVDKINCSGKIYLEPKHPGYREGGVYRFTLLREEFIHDAAENRLKRLILLGIYNDTHEMLILPQAGTLRLGEEVEVLVRRIKKGRLMLDFHSPGDLPLIIEGGRYLFRMETKGSQNHYIIVGPGGVQSKLKLADYQGYDLKPGDNFWGYLVKWDPDDVPVIEPEHPFYHPGGVYPFTVLRSEPAEGTTRSWMHVLIVADCFGNEIRVAQQIQGKSAVPLPATTICSVERMKRGRPVLRVTE